MVDIKISALNELNTATDEDEIVIVDKEDTSMASSGSTRKIKVKNLIKADGLVVGKKFTLTNAGFNSIVHNLGVIPLCFILDANGLEIDFSPTINTALNTIYDFRGLSIEGSNLTIVLLIVN